MPVDFAGKRIRDGECQMTSSDHVAGGKKETEVLKDHGDRRVVPASSIMMGVLSTTVYSSFDFSRAIVNRFRNPLFEFPSSITFVTIPYSDFVTWLIVETAGL